jgi:hypothetical protein
VCGYKGNQISVYLLATAVCGYKGFHISVYLQFAAAVCGYKGYHISVYHLAMTVCGYRGYQTSVYLLAIPDFRIPFSHSGKKSVHTPRIYLRKLST